MGEYIKWKGSTIKIGTVESLYYITYDRFKQAYDAGHLSGIPGNMLPSEYLMPNAGFLFRFPFPDEDSISQLELGHRNHDRGFEIKVSDPTFVSDITREKYPGGLYPLEIKFQKLVNREGDQKLILAVVVSDPIGNRLYRIEDDASMRNLLKQIIKHNILYESNDDKKAQMVELGLRILRGYKMERNIHLTQDRNAREVNDKVQKGKGLK